MFFRFAAALFLVVLVSMTSVFIEKRTLELRREISLQYYQTDVMIELQVQLRLEAQKLLAPTLADPVRSSPAVAGASATGSGEHGALLRDAAPDAASEAMKPATDNGRSANRLPLLRFQQPFRPEGID